MGKKYKFVLFELNPSKTEIVVKEASAETDYDEFLSKLPENDALYAVYDFEYELKSGEGQRSKLVFYAWSPDSAPIKAKMLYASSKDALRRSLNGISADIQGTDYSEVSYETILEKVSRGAGNH